MTRFVRALVATNLKSSMALRGAFLLQASLMALNNFMFMSIWWVLLTRFEQVRGYRLADMSALFGLCALGFGVGMVLFGGVRELAVKIVDGELDALLSQPKSVLLRAISARSFAAGWGDIASGLLLLHFSGYLSWERAPALLIAVASAATVIVACAVLMNASAFWLGHVDGAARSGFEFMLTLCMYPPDLFGGQFRLVLFTVLPAGLATYLPIALIKEPSLTAAVQTFAGALAYATFACLVFQRGLRRYASGSRMTIWS